MADAAGNRAEVNSGIYTELSRVLIGLGGHFSEACFFVLDAGFD